MRYKVSRKTTAKKQYIVKKLKMLKEFCIKITPKDMEKFNLSKSEIEVDQIFRRIVLEGLE